MRIVARCSARRHGRSSRRGLAAEWDRYAAERTKESSISEPSSLPEEDRSKQLATGFDMEPLPNGNVLIEFFGDDGKTSNTQEVARSVVRHLPLVAFITEVALSKGPKVAKEIMEKLGREDSVG